MKYKLVVCGGTFDHFHKGHKEFLRYALSLGEKVLIGLTGDKYFQETKPQSKSLDLIEGYETRKKSLVSFLEEINAKERVDIVEINDLFGPTLSKDLKIDAIVISENTRNGAKLINEKRKEIDLEDLEIFLAPSVLAEDGKMISSGRIRKGEIDREGKLYIDESWINQDLKLTEELRKKLKNPIGILLKKIEKPDNNILMVTVGDVTTKLFNDRLFGQEISVIDFKVARKNKYSKISELGFSDSTKIIRANNPPGFLTSDLLKKIKNIFKEDLGNKIVLQIDGEEDLSVLPLVLFAPLGAVIYYGQPDEGLVEVRVSENAKNEAKKILNGLSTRGH